MDIQSVDSVIESAKERASLVQNPQPMEIRFIHALVCAMESSDDPNGVYKKWRETIVGNYNLTHRTIGVIWYVWGEMLTVNLKINLANTLSMLADPTFKIKIDRFNLGDSFATNDISKDDVAKGIQKAYSDFSREDCNVDEIWQALKGIIDRRTFASRFEVAWKEYLRTGNKESLMVKLDEMLRVENNKKPNPQLHDIKKLGSFLAREIRDKRKRGGQFIPTCLPEVNKDVMGGWTREEVNAIVAPSGSGKSILALRQAVETARSGKHVVYVSLELSPYQMVTNLAIMMTDVTKQEIISVVEDREIENLEAYINEAVDAVSGSIRFFCAPEMDIDHLVHYLGVIVGLEPADLIVVDLVNNISTDKHYNLSTDKYKDFMLRLKEVAQTYNLAVLITAQMSIASTREDTVSLEFVGESRFIGNYASLVLHVRKPPAEHPVEGTIGYAEMLILKGRENGIATGRAFVYDFDSIHLTYLFNKKYKNMGGVIRYLKKLEKERQKLEESEENDGTPKPKRQQRSRVELSEPQESDF